jgi:uncharacterized protein (TIGR00255 family)
MTGYGRGIKATDCYSVTIEVKSVNHRYLELFFKIPRYFSFLEDKLRRIVSNKIARGKLEIAVIVEKLTVDEITVELNRSLVNSYLQAISELKNEFNINENPTLQTLISLPEVFKSTHPEEDQEKLLEVAGSAFEEALAALIEMRKIEAAGLVKDLQAKIRLLEKYKDDLRRLAPTVVLNYQERLEKRLQELASGIEIDPNRLAMEVAVFADKADITEELVRIESHLQQFLRTLTLIEPVGRRLDFIIQELNREINTVGSKASDLQIAQTVIEFKCELEKIREQIQNIE